ncbi:unnamed protein product [Oppiella nova]|uniref:AB hydrolase-1 domain-containing protein n=1 Tax=Oppiella nova TaxID=334625 RepID=A0A7R9QB95_9ACAR|nr:unnamed protein product [Oppiella nova]CAG2161769.1 unnamed protein product [Oppiella nova]
MGFLVNTLSILVVILAILFTVFVNYPEPPLSPLLYQWQSSGHYFHFKGYQVFYKDELSESAANDITVLSLHGFPTSSFDWYKILPDMRRNVRRFIAPDFLGFGLSDKPRFHSYSIVEQTDLIEELMMTLKVDTNVHILGHDYGDTVAQELMARQIDGNLSFRIASVCLLNGGIFPTIHKPILMQTLLRSPILGTILSKLSNYYMFSMALSGVFGPNSQPSRDDLHDFWKLIRQKDGYRVMGDILSYIDDRRQHEDRWVGALRTNQMPLHFIYGPSDPINRSPEFPNTYRKIIPNPSIDVLDDQIGHYPQLESHKRVIQLYLNWLKSRQFITQLVFNT